MGWVGSFWFLASLAVLGRTLMRLLRSCGAPSWKNTIRRSLSRYADRSRGGMVPPCAWPCFWHFQRLANRVSQDSRGHRRNCYASPELARM